MTEPALRRRDEATRDLRAAPSRRFTEDPTVALVETRLRIDLPLDGGVEAGRQQRQPLRLRERRPLSYRKELDGCAAAGGRRRHDRIGGAEVDADDVRRRRR